MDYPKYDDVIHQSTLIKRCVDIKQVYDTVHAKYVLCPA